VAVSLGVDTGLELRTNVFALPIGGGGTFGGAAEPEVNVGESALGRLFRPALYRRDGALLSAPWGEPFPWEVTLGIGAALLALGLVAAVKLLRGR